MSAVENESRPKRLRRILALGALIGAWGAVLVSPAGAELIGSTSPPYKPQWFSETERLIELTSFGVHGDCTWRNGHRSWGPDDGRPIPTTGEEDYFYYGGYSCLASDESQYGPYGFHCEGRYASRTGEKEWKADRDEPIAWQYECGVYVYAEFPHNPACTREEASPYTEGTPTGHGGPPYVRPAIPDTGWISHGRGFDCSQMPRILQEAMSRPRFIPEPVHKPKPPLGSQAGIVCGTARFDFYAINAVQDSDSIRKGDRACMVALSNELTRELGGGAGFTTALILSRFGTLIREELGDRLAREEASRLRKKVTMKNVLRALGPIGKTISKTNAVVNIGKGIGLALLVYSASQHYKQVIKHRACTRILLAQDGGRLHLGGGILYSPSGLDKPGEDGYLTQASVWQQEEKRFRPDKWTRKASGLKCKDNGRVDYFDGNQMFSSPTVAMVKF